MTTQSSTQSKNAPTLADQTAHDVTPLTPPVGASAVSGANTPSDPATASLTNTSADPGTNLPANPIGKSINADSSPSTSTGSGTGTGISASTRADDYVEPTFDFSADADLSMVMTNMAPSNQSDQWGQSDQADPWDLSGQSDPSDPSADQDEWAQADEAAPSDEAGQLAQPGQPYQAHKPEQPEQPGPENKSGTATGTFDCANYVAEKMLDQAFGPLGNAPRPGLFIVQAPDRAWAEIIHDLIRPWLKRQPRKTQRRPSQRRSLYRGPTICCEAVALGEPASENIRETALARESKRLLSSIEDGLAAGSAVFVVTDNLEMVPLPLRHAADRIFVVSPPNRKALTALLRAIAPGKEEIDPLDRPNRPDQRHRSDQRHRPDQRSRLDRFDWTDMKLASLTPHMLRLAYRPGTQIDMFLQRLKQLATPAPKIVEHKIIPFERLHGVDQAKIWADELKQDLQDYAAQKLTWPQARRSLLLYGVPGTAKTTLAGAIAAHCNIAFVPTSYAKWQRDQQGHLGDVLRAMASVFAEARACAPCVLFIDELDTLGSRGDNSPQRSDWWRSIINALLEQIAGVDSNEGVIIIGATNYPELIDPAILRSGRMEDHIALHPPTAEALARIYADELEGQCAATVDLLKIGHMSAGKTGADVVRICAAVRRKARTGKRQVTQEDLIAALNQDGKTLSGDDRRRIAIHEAGHAVVMHQLDGVEVTSITVIGAGETGGATISMMTEPNFLTPSLLETRLIALMGGRAAEAVLLGDVSSGSGGAEGSDLGSATVLAAEAELSLGLGRQGLIWQMPPTARTVGDWLGRRPDVAEAVGQRLNRAYQRACELIRARISTVEKLAEALLRHQALAGEDLARLLQDDAVPGDTTPLPDLSCPDPRCHGLLSQDTLSQDPLGHDPVGQKPLGQDPVGQAPLGQEPLGQDPISGKPTHSEGSAPSGANSRRDDRGATPSDASQASTKRPGDEPSAI